MENGCGDVPEYCQENKMYVFYNARDTDEVHQNLLKYVQTCPNFDIRHFNEGQKEPLLYRAAIRGYSDVV